MRQEKAGVTQILLDSAKAEFLQYGFHDASLRRISSASGVSTNSIYTRFGDKAGLFSAVVSQAADGLMDLYLSSISEADKCDNVDSASNVGDEGTNQVLEYIYQYLDEFYLIFCHSQGTEYETYFDRLTEIEENYYRKFLAQYIDGGEKVDEFFIHVYCRMGWQYIYELVTHKKSYEEACKFMETVRKIRHAGWKGIVKLTSNSDI